MSVPPARRSLAPPVPLALLTAVLAGAHLWLIHALGPQDPALDTGPAAATVTAPLTAPVTATRTLTPGTAQASIIPARPGNPAAARARQAPATDTPAQPATGDAANAAAGATEPSSPHPLPAGPGALLVPAPTPAGTSPGALDDALAHTGPASVPAGTPTGSAVLAAASSARMASAAPADAVARSTLSPLSSANAAPPAAGAATPWATQLPPSAQLTYVMRRGSLSGTGELNWQLERGQYQLTLEGRLPLIGSILLQASQGTVDSYGIAPVRHTERRIGRSERAVNFIRHANGQGEYIAFSASTQTEPLTPGTQDRVSWMPQLAARLAAWPASHAAAAHPPAGTVLAMEVASVSGSVRRWNFRMLDVTPEGWLHLQRDPESEHDTRSEVWLDPKRHSWPVRVVSVENNGEPIELILRELHAR